jgi:hypothetical protein
MARDLKDWAKPAISHVQTEIPDWLAQYYEKLAEDAQKLSQRTVQPGRPERRLAPIPEDIRQAHRMGRNVGRHVPYLNRAEHMIGKSGKSFPERYQQYLNPYMQSVVNRISEEGGRTFKERILPEIEAHFVKLGQHGSSRHAKMAERMARDLQNEILAKQQQALASGYQQAAQISSADAARQLEAARETGDIGARLQAGSLADMQALMEQGRYQQQQEQALRDIKHQEELKQEEEPYRKLAEFSSILHGAPIAPSQTSTTYQTSGTPQLNTIGQLGNIAAGIYGLRAAMGKKRGGRIPPYFYSLYAS